LECLAHFATKVAVHVDEQRVYYVEFGFQEIAKEVEKVVAKRCPDSHRQLFSLQVDMEVLLLFEVANGTHMVLQ
jgi:hypothetical protein